MLSPATKLIPSSQPALIPGRPAISIFNLRKLPEQVLTMALGTMLVSNHEDSCDTLI